MKICIPVCFLGLLLYTGDIMPFDYDLHILSIPGTSPRTMICCHGYGGNYTLAEQLKQLNVTDATLVGFNFPDHDVVASFFE